MPFTHEQLAAINADNPELLVSAAAGSGKTAVLVERILRMVTQRGLSIDRMLVVTFTRAAAAELRERLELRLTDAAQSDARLRSQVELLPSAQISTIHGYCTRVLREHFQHCDIDPQFMVCEPATRERLFLDSMERTLDRLYELAREDADYAALVGKFTEKELAAMLPPLYDFLLSRPDPFAWFEQCAEKAWSADGLDETPVGQAILNEARLICACAATLLDEARALSAEQGFLTSLNATLGGDTEAWRLLDDAAQRGLGALCGCVDNLKFPVIARVKPQDEREATLLAEFKDFRERHKKLATELKCLLPESLAGSVDDMNAMRGALMGLCKAVRLFHEDFSDGKRELARVDFTDLEHMTLQVLSDPRLREIEQSRFDAVFVDEYQDVSAIQEAVLNGLKRGDGKQSYFYVGDVKQSIYRFRLAEPKLFLSKQRSFSTNEDAPQRLIVLNRNFRSRTTVLSSVNRVFGQLMDSRVTELDYDESARLVPGLSSTGDPQTELHIIHSDGLKPAQRVIAEATAIADDILATVGTPILDASGEVAGTLHYRDIAVLMPVSKGVADKVEQVLRERGVPVYCENAADSMHSDEITQAVQHLRLMDNLMDDLSLISELRSPLFEMSEAELARVRLCLPKRGESFLSALMVAADSASDERLRERCRSALDLLERERFLLGGMPLDEYLWDFLQRSGLYAHYGAQPGGKLRQANLQMLCSLASDYERGRSEGLRGFLDSLGADLKLSGGLSPTVVNPWEDVVRLMTIHKSKGLEFPIVYVMGLGGALRKRSQSGRLSYHAQLGVGLQYVNELARSRRKTIFQQAAELTRRGEDLAERARLLYVAMTRAKSRIVLLGSCGADTFNYEQAVSMRRNGYMGGGVHAVRSAGSMLEWLVHCVRPWDVCEARDFSTSPMRILRDESTFSTLSTGFPPKESVWRVVFHIAPSVTRLSRDRGNVNSSPVLFPVQTEDISCDDTARDPIAPRLDLTHYPLKLGVTAICRAMNESAPAYLPDDAQDESEPETPRLKRTPLALAPPRLLAAAPIAPAFLLPQKESLPLLRGTATHKLLCMIDLDGARCALAAQGEPNAEKSLHQYALGERERLRALGVLDAREAENADAGLCARFLASDMGRRMLASDEVHREWRFNLRVNEPFPTVAQGVIDLCFAEQGGWVLVDFKTDRVTDEAALVARYAPQLGLYRQALRRATDRPVRECALFSLSLSRTLLIPDD